MNDVRTRCFLLVFVSGAIALLAAPPIAWSQGDLPNPEKPGPFPVGVTTVLLVDHSRTDAATNGPRSLMTEIWYPATDDTRNLSKAGLLDTYLKEAPALALGAIKALVGVDLAAFDKQVKFFAIRDARIRDGVFPLLLFSHGDTGTRIQSIFWCEHLASHGYLVMAPDHTGNSLVTFIDGKVVMYNRELRDQSAKDRPKDISFLIDAMDHMNKGADSRFLGKVDLAHIGVAGHSFGGYTAVAAADLDPRITAIAPIAGLCHERTNFTCPVMILLATEDRTLSSKDNDTMRKYYEDSKGPHYFVEFLNGGHFSFTEIQQFNPTFGDGVGTGTRVSNGQPLAYTPMDVVFALTNGYTTAFFGRYLKGLSGYDAYLAANHRPEELVVKSQAP